MTRILLLFCSLFLAGSLSAQDINLLPEGQTLIRLSVTERTRVEQDLLVASLRVEAERSEAAELQDFINEQMSQALDTLREEIAEEEDVELSTGHYSVYRQDSRPQGGRSNVTWRGSQTLELRGRGSELILRLAGELQDQGFVMNQLSWQLSTERADEVRETMLESAIARVRQKAERSAAALGRPDVELAILEVDDTLNYHQPMMMMRTGSAEMDAPVAEAGESEVSLTVSAHAVAR